MKQKILVFGGMGQVGLALRGTRDMWPDCDLIFLSHAEVDITNADSVQTACDQYKPDCVVNAAGYTGVDAAETDRMTAFAVNETGACNIARSCAAQNIPMIHLSTDYVFDGTKTTPYTERDKENPLSVYGASKLAGDRAVIATHAKHIILRSGWIFSLSGKSFLTKMIKLCRARSDIGVVADQIGCPTPAHAVAHAILTIAQRICDANFDEWGVYHYCGAPVATWYDMAVLIDQCLREKNEKSIAHIRPIQTSEYPLPAQRPNYSVLDTGAIQHFFGITPPDWRQAIKDYIAKEGVPAA
jgi:dTDP-4-dehydrorhamnose reductase